MARSEGLRNIGKVIVGGSGALLGLANDSVVVSAPAEQVVKIVRPLGALNGGAFLDALAHSIPNVAIALAANKLSLLATWATVVGASIAMSGIFGMRDARLAHE